MSLRRVFSIAVLSTIVAVSSMSFAQSQDVPKIEIFGGYSWYHPGGTVPAVSNGLKTDIQDFRKGWGGQFTYNVNRFTGLTADISGHYGDFGSAHSITVGPQFRARFSGFTAFGEILGGWQHISPKQYPEQNASVLITGGGVEYQILPRLSFRALQADYVLSSYNEIPNNYGNNRLDGVRIQSGLVFALGSLTPAPPLVATCSATPAAVDAGAPVQLSVAVTGVQPKHPVSYTYSATGGKVSGKDATATVDTTNLAPGSYTVSAKVADNQKGKNQKFAGCQASFSVNEPPKHPPVLSVSANPSNLTSGDSATITASGSSPDNRPLSYHCAASAGSLSGNGSSYTLDTAGVPAGSIHVDCTTTDDRSLSASASTTVQVAARPAPKAMLYGTIGFAKDKKRPARVDNEAKGELDRYADALAAAPDAKGVIVGDNTAKEAKKQPKKAAPLAARRAVNTKDYVTTEKGIDAARVDASTGSADEQKADLWIVPAGATFSENVTKVDETKVKAVPRKAAHKGHKKAKK